MDVAIYPLSEIYLVKQASKQTNKKGESPEFKDPI